MSAPPKGVVDVLTEIFFEGQAAIAAFERPDGLWDVTAYFADPPDLVLVRELVANAAGPEGGPMASFSTALKPRTGSRRRWKIWCRSRPDALSSMASMTATVSRPTSSASRSRRRWRRHRPSRHHTRLPVAARPCAEGVASAPGARSRHRHRRAGDCRGQGAAREHSGERHRPAVGSGRARERAAEPQTGHLIEMIHATGFAAPRIRAKRPVRPGAGEHPRQPASATGNADGAASGALGAGDPVGPADASGG